MRWLLLAGLTGCYAPTYAPGAPCSIDVGCPGDLVCDPAQPAGPTCVHPGDVGTLVDAATEVDAATDATDGLPFDHDADLVPDSLDNCPHITNADQSDADDDGVGDVCDPGEGKHEIAAFFGFYGTTLPPELVPDNLPAWSVADGFARVSITSNALSSLTYTPVTGENLFVTTTFTIEAIDPPVAGQHRNVGIAHQHAPADNISNTCAINYNFDMMASTLWLLGTMNAQTIREIDFADFEEGETYSIITADATRRNEAWMTCAAARTPTQVTVSGAKVVPEAAGNRVSLRTRGTTTRFDYMLVIVGAPIRQ